MTDAINRTSRNPLRDAFIARDHAWNDRVARLGVERSIYHSKHQAQEFAAVTELQRAAIWPHLCAALTGSERTVLDFGCGYGRWTPMLAQLIGSAVGVDPTAALLAYAEAHRPDTLPRPTLRYARYQYGRIPAPAKSFDVIWFCMVLSTVLDDAMFAATLAELKRVAKPGALVCLIDNTSKSNGQPVRSKYSISRTIDEYVAAFSPWADLSVRGDYVDFNEINTVFVGRARG